MSGLWSKFDIILSPTEKRDNHREGLMLGFGKIKLLITRVVLNPGSVELAQSQLSFKDNLKIKS